MNESEILDSIKKEVEKIFEKESGCHDFEHTMRVYNLCMHIGKIENADLTILAFSALLHDIAKPKEIECKRKICHAKEGSLMAKKMLEKYGLDNVFIETVCSCIRTHRSKTDDKPNTKEAKILYDSDKLDGIGAVGIGRTFMFAEKLGAKLHNDKSIDVIKTKEYSNEDTAYREYITTLRHIKDKLFTNEGRRIAKGRHDFMVEFFERLNKEVDGEL